MGRFACKSSTLHFQSGFRLIRFIQLDVPWNRKNCSSRLHFSRVRMVNPLYYYSYLIYNRRMFILNMNNVNDIRASDIQDRTLVLGILRLIRSILLFLNNILQGRPRRLSISQI